MNKHYQKGNGFFFNVNNPNIGGLPEVSGYPDCCPPVFMDKLMSNNTNEIPQSGGKKKKSKKNKKSNYKTIYNPKTKRFVKLEGKIGQQIIKNYVNKLYQSMDCDCQIGDFCAFIKQKGGNNIGADINAYPGLNSNFSSNMMDRTFGCKQPTWEPSCI